MTHYKNSETQLHDPSSEYESPLAMNKSFLRASTTTSRPPTSTASANNPLPVKPEQQSLPTSQNGQPSNITTMNILTPIETTADMRK